MERKRHKLFKHKNQYIDRSYPIRTITKKIKLSKYEDQNPKTRNKTILMLYKNHELAKLSSWICYGNE